MIWFLCAGWALTALCLWDERQRMVYWRRECWKARREVEALRRAQ